MAWFVFYFLGFSLEKGTKYNKVVILTDLFNKVNPDL